MKFVITICLIISTSNLFMVFGQVSINSDGSDPDTSAMLDIKSIDKGVLIPRMNNLQRTGIINPAKGLMVYDSSAHSFWFFRDTAWTEIKSGPITAIHDADNNTKIQVEESSNEDKVRIDIDNSERIVIEKSTSGGTLINLPNNNFNTFLGEDAGQATIQLNEIDGRRNNFIGYQAGYSNTIGSKNVFIGSEAARLNQSGGENVALGYLSLRDNKTGSLNTAIGATALAASTGHSNTALGHGAMALQASGNFNTAIGRQAMTNNYTGSNNSVLGFRAGYFNEDGSGNVFLGYSAGLNYLGDNKLFIENSDSDTPLIYGDFDTDRVTINGALTSTGALSVHGKIILTDEVHASAGVFLTNSFAPDPDYVGNIGNSISFGHHSNSEDFLGYKFNDFYFRDSPGGSDTEQPGVHAAAFTTYSSRRWKHDIQDLNKALSVIQKLRGVTYTWNEDHGGKDDFGFIAEEVNAVLPQIAKKGIDGQVDGVSYGKLTPYLVEAIKEQQDEIEELRKENQLLKEKTETFESEIAALKAAVFGKKKTQ